MTDVVSKNSVIIVSVVSVELHILSIMRFCMILVVLIAERKIAPEDYPFAVCFHKKRESAQVESVEKFVECLWRLSLNVIDVDCKCVEFQSLRFFQFGFAQVVQHALQTGLVALESKSFWICAKFTTISESSALSNGESGQSM